MGSLLGKTSSARQVTENFNAVMVTSMLSFGRKNEGGSPIYV